MKNINHIPIDCEDDVRSVSLRRLFPIDYEDDVSSVSPSTERVLIPPICGSPERPLTILVFVFFFSRKAWFLACACASGLSSHHYCIICCTNKSTSFARKKAHHSLYLWTSWSANGNRLNITRLWVLLKVSDKDKCTVTYLSLVTTNNMSGCQAARLPSCWFMLFEKKNMVYSVQNYLRFSGFGCIS